MDCGVFPKREEDVATTPNVAAAPVSIWRRLGELAGWIRMVFSLIVFLLS
jgi:hypothetical protein